WTERQNVVKSVFNQSWQAYKRDAWGFDIYHPVSHTGENMGPEPLGWIIVDALDTLAVMNLTEEVSLATKWIEQELDYNMDYEVNLFETTIRMLGGLLGGYYLTGQPSLLTKAVDLADRLVDGNVFDTPSGLPMATVNLRTGQGRKSHTDFGSSSTAEVATLQLEFRYLSKLTGNDKYKLAVDHIMTVLESQNRLNPEREGLVPIFIDVDKGQYRGQNIRLGSRGDSYYEYLLKQYLQTNCTESFYKTMYDESVRGIQNHLLGHTAISHNLYLGERPHGIKGELSNKMDHLVCFMGGLLALGATEGRSLAEARTDSNFWTLSKEVEIEIAEKLTQTCVKMYENTGSGLAPEIAFFNDDNDTGKPLCGVSALRQFDLQRFGYDCLKDDLYIKPADAHNLQRPETVESLFVLWRITGKDIYREWGWEIFTRFREWTEVKGDETFDINGFTSLQDVNSVPPKQRDNMESFWLAETLKYFYLLFEEDETAKDAVDLKKIVFNTEAHILP
ncbi:family 47 glycosyl hydrolase, partial [Nadsonia fulvescens var. elongata DSM 6958]